MNAHELNDFARFVVILKTHAIEGLSSSSVATHAVELRQHAKTLSRIAETECNRELTDREKKKEKKLVREIAAILECYPGVGATFSGDPRGYAVKLTFPSGACNEWGGAWGI